METAKELQNHLKKIDHKGYPAYKELRGKYRFATYTLSIDHVQGDPFASPSKVSVHVKGSRANFPRTFFNEKHVRIAVQDDILRNFKKCVDNYTFKAKGSGKSGLISVSSCGQEVLERTTCQINPANGDCILQMEIGFPANGRTINARELEKILFAYLPDCVEQALMYENVDQEHLQHVVELAEDQEAIRRQLQEKNLIAFVANGSMLPRESGVSAKPMKGGIPFVSPKELEVELQLPHYGVQKGMGIPKGITLIVGGGYHGKSTLLKALELGVYPHISGDGREYVVTDSSAMKIRAEDGRCIRKTDISMFIHDLPNGKETCGFYTEDASGSTSQAANVVEALEAEAKVLLIDEDTSATNFMIRDQLMQRVIQREMEPITPFIERIRELYEEYDVSTVIVAGSSGAYFQIADQIIQMNRYEPKDITIFAKQEAVAFPSMTGEKMRAQKPMFDRCPKQSKGFGKEDRVKIKTFGRESISINRETIDLRYVEQLVDNEQLVALGYCVKYIEQSILGNNEKKTVQTIVKELEEFLEQEGMKKLCGRSGAVASMAMPRRQEIFATWNRYRGMKL